MELRHWGPGRGQSKGDWEAEILALETDRKQHHLLETRGGSQEEIKWSAALDTQERTSKLRTEKQSLDLANIRSLVILVISVTLWGQKPNGRVVGKKKRGEKKEQRVQIFFPKCYLKSSRRRKMEQCYGLNAVSPQKCMCWRPTPQCDGIWRWGTWEVISLRWRRESRALVIGLMTL